MPQLAANTTYATQTDEKFSVPAIDVAEIDPKNIRQQVNYETSEPAGTIVVDTAKRFIYLVQEGGHGYGTGFAGTPSALWPELFDAWLSRQP